jgi:AraC-like DNA-binding protein
MDGRTKSGVPRVDGASSAADGSQNKAYEELYLFEHDIFQRVRLGVLPVNQSPHPIINNEWFKASVGDYVTYGRNQYITYCGVACKAAIDGGAQVADAFMLWKYYQRELDLIQGADELDTLADRMLNDFSGLNVQDVAAEKYPDRLGEAMRHIRQNLSHPLRVTQLAEGLGCSRSQLDREFSKYLGCSPSEYIVRERLRCAKMYLHFTERSVAEIGESLGFADPAHFSATFKRCEGLSPRAYRERCQSHG